MTEIPPLEVSMHLSAEPHELFRYFTEPAYHVAWMGSEAWLDPMPGGEYRIRMPDGFEAAGQFRHVDPPNRVVFTWGFASEEAAQRTKHERSEATTASVMPPGRTLVTVTLNDEDNGTRLTLRHDNLPNAELREGIRIGWDTYLPRLAIIASGGDPGADPHT